MHALKWLLLGALHLAAPGSGPDELTASKAIGSTHDGHLARPAHLEPTRVLRFKGGTPSAERYGTEELVGMVRRAAGAVAREAGGTLTVGDLSRLHGGSYGSHASHANGRDADIGFYYVDRSGRRTATRGFYAVRDDGTAGSALALDARRTWLLVRAMLTDPGVEISDVLVAEQVERRLLAEARREGTPEWLYQRARLVMYQPRSGGVHDDHMHVRIRCPVDDVECVD